MWHFIALCCGQSILKNDFFFKILSQNNVILNNDNIDCIYRREI